MNTVTEVVPTFYVLEFAGLPARGPISVPGVKAGDIAVVWFGSNFYNLFEGGLEFMIVSVDDEIQQTAYNLAFGTEPDLSGQTFKVLMARMG